MDDSVQAFREALASLDRVRAEALFQQALSHLAPIHAVEQLVVPALEQLGHAWEAGSVALSQIYLSGRICEDLVARVLPPDAPERRTQPTQAIVVLSDYHMLGKRIVYSVLRASGFELMDFGRMEPDELVTRVVAEKVRILLISTLMLPSALLVRQVRDELDARGEKPRILVGGAPFLFDAELWREVGADAMGRSATDAVEIIRGWQEESP